MKVNVLKTNLKKSLFGPTLGQSDPLGQNQTYLVTICVNLDIGKQVKQLKNQVLRLISELFSHWKKRSDDAHSNTDSYSSDKSYDSDKRK